MERSKSLVGDWEKIQAYLKKLPGDLKKVGEEISIEIATLTAAEIKRYIRMHQMIETGQYLQVVNAHKDSKGFWYAGVQDILHSNVTPMRSLALWLEAGTHNEDGTWKMHPRPHYRTAYTALPQIVAKVVISKGFKFVKL